uniref:Superoxide dismutase n=1 Tax=Angiostrongylus cantonensis TaxID=6313 RepID=A0A0K0DJZ7_ANGCA
MCSVTLKVSTAPEKVLRARAVMLRAIPGGTPTEPAGTVDFTQRGNVLTVSGRVSGLTPGLHGMHVHQNGNLGNGCLAAGDHYNPFNMNHGSPNARVRHVGDLGNIVAGLGVLYVSTSPWHCVSLVAKAIYS